MISTVSRRAALLKAPQANILRTNKRYFRTFRNFDSRDLEPLLDKIEGIRPIGSIVGTGMGIGYALDYIHKQRKEEQEKLFVNTVLIVGSGVGGAFLGFRFPTTTIIFTAFKVSQNYLNRKG